jgi:hypothetical protein
MSPARQRFTWGLMWRRVPIRFSMQLVVAKNRRRVGGSPSFTTVSVSSSPSRRPAAAAASPFVSSHRTSADSCRRAAAALVAPYARRRAARTYTWRAWGTSAARLRPLWSWQR